MQLKNEKMSAVYGIINDKIIENIDAELGLVAFLIHVQYVPSGIVIDFHIAHIILVILVFYISLR